MAIGIVNNESAVALKVESTSGTYVAPTASTDYIEVLSEGTSLNKTREELSRNTLGSSTEQEASRVGIAEVTAELAVEFGASAEATAGAAPQRLDLILRSGLGGKRTNTLETTTTSNTSTVLNFTSHGILKGDIVLVREAGAFELRPVASVTSTTVTLAFALSNGAPSDEVEVEAFTTYYSDTSSSVSLSMEHSVGNTVLQKAAGLRVQSMSLENWSAGQIPSFNASLGGLSLERADGEASYTPDFTADALPPVALSACLYINGTMLSYSELGMSIENTLSFLIDACSASGKVNSRITDQVTTFSCKKYSDDTTLTEWDNFNANDDVSVFFYAYNPSSTAGEFSECVAVWLPQGKITAAPFGDQDGIVTDDLEIKAHRSAGNDSVFIGFI